ncbi:MAG: hypothetical protein WEC39_00905 [Patescibacteria group bacterium]
MYKAGLNIKTFEAKIILGAKVGYSKEDISPSQVRNAIKMAARKVKDFTFSGTLTFAEIIVSGQKEYGEPAFLLESSIYPRYPQEKETFKKKIIEFTGNLLMLLKQERGGVRFTDETILIETEYCKNPSIA